MPTPLAAEASRQRAPTPAGLDERRRGDAEEHRHAEEVVAPALRRLLSSGGRPAGRPRSGRCGTRPRRAGRPRPRRPAAPRRPSPTAPASSSVPAPRSWRAAASPAGPARARSPGGAAGRSPDGSRLGEEGRHEERPAAAPARRRAVIDAHARQRYEIGGGAPRRGVPSPRPRRSVASRPTHRGGSPDGRWRWSVVARPRPAGHLAQGVELVVGLGVGVLLRHLRAELDVLATASRNSGSSGIPASSSAFR